jgi:hypothetical protein
MGEAPDAMRFQWDPRKPAINRAKHGVSFEEAMTQRSMTSVKAEKTKTRRTPADDVLPEYDFSRSRPNKYASRYPKDCIVITLDPDVAEVFPGAREANEALRALAGVIRNYRPRRTSRRRA